MPRNLLIASVLGLFALVGAVVFLVSAPADQGTDLLPSIGPRPVAPHRAPTEESDQNPLNPIATSAFNRDEEDPLASVARSERQHKIQVVDSEGTPVAGASLKVVFQDRQRGRFPGFGNEGDDERLVAETVTGRDGIARVAGLPERPLELRARRDAVAGHTRFDPREESVDELPPGIDARVALAPIKTVAVRVIDPAGKGVAGIGVSLASARGQGFPGGPPGGGGRGGQRGGTGARQGSTDGEGRWTVELTNEDTDLFTAESLEARTTLFAVESKVGDVRPTSGKVAEVVLEVPFTVTLDLELRDDVGKLHVPRTQVTIQVASEDGAEGFGRGMFRNRIGSRAVNGGHLQMAGFPLGAKVDVDTSSRDRMSTSEQITLPTTPGLHKVEVRVGQLQPLVVAKLTESDGSVARGERVGVTVSYDDAPDQAFDFRRMMANGGNTTVRADQEGLVRIPVDPSRTGRILLEKPDANRGFGGMGPGRGETRPRDPLATVPFPALDSGDDVDMGAVVLDRGPLLVAGTVIDANDKPVSGARVRVQSQATNPGPGGRGGRGGRGENGDEGDASDEKGRFAIHAVSDPNLSYEVLAEGQQLVGVPTPFTPGSDTVVVRLLAAGGIKGAVTVAVPELAKELDVEIRVRSVAARDNEREWRSARRNEDGKFLANRLLPGTYDVQILVESKEERTVFSVEVPAGATVSPPELEALVVGQRYILAEVRVVGPDGLPVRGAFVSLTNASAPAAPDGNGRGNRRNGPGGGGGAGSSATDSDGLAKIPWSPDGRTNVSVRSREHSPANVEAAEFPLTVRLIGQRVLTVVFSEPLPELAENSRFVVALVDPRTALPAEGADPMQWAMTLFQSLRGGPMGNVRGGATQVELRNTASGPRDIYLATMPDFGRGPGGRGGRGGNGQRGAEAPRGTDFPLPLKLGTVTIPDEAGPLEARVTVSTAALAQHFAPKAPTNQD